MSLKVRKFTWVQVREYLDGNKAWQIADEIAAVGYAVAVGLRDLQREQMVLGGATVVEEPRQETVLVLLAHALEPVGDQLKSEKSELTMAGRKICVCRMFSR